MTNDRFAAQLRRHLLETADARPADGQLASIADRVAVTAQRPPLVAQLWPSDRIGPFPSAAVRLALLAALVVLATLALVIVGGGATRPSPADELLRGFLQARIAGSGAEAFFETRDCCSLPPLLYATTSGAPYERAEFEPLRGIEWPYRFKAYRVRLFAGQTVVEQLVFMATEAPLGLEYNDVGFATDIPPTTENGRPVASTYTYFDGEVTLRAAHPWLMSRNGQRPYGRLIPGGSRVPPTTDGAQRDDWDEMSLMADPPLVGTACRTAPEPTDAHALAVAIRSDPGLHATAPVPVRAGGADGLMMDVVLPAGAPLCWNANDGGDPTDHPGVLFPVADQTSVNYAGDEAMSPASGEWMRLYLFDAPEGPSIRILAIAIVAPQSTFERAVEAAAPVVESIQFHAP